MTAIIVQDRGATDVFSFLRRLEGGLSSLLSDRVFTVGIKTVLSNLFAFVGTLLFLFLMARLHTYIQEAARESSQLSAKTQDRIGNRNTITSLAPKAPMHGSCQ